MKALQVIREHGWKEFIKRWKAGIESTTPLQQAKAQVLFTNITLIGIALGFAASIYGAKNLWWLAIILGAAFGNTYIGLIAIKQKIKLLKQFEVKLEECKGVKTE